jgi:hypothetical protein
MKDTQTPWSNGILNCAGILVHFLHGNILK